MLEGEEYDLARKQANNMNKLIHDAIPSTNGMDIHEIQPVKFGGDPTDLANKIPLSRQDHITLNKFWNALKNKLK